MNILSILVPASQYADLEVSVKKWMVPPGDTAAIPNMQFTWIRGYILYFGCADSKCDWLSKTHQSNQVEFIDNQIACYIAEYSCFKSLQYTKLITDIRALSDSPV